MSIHPVTRRGFLNTSGALIAWAFMPRIASAAPARDPRFVAIVLRGALDGLAAVAPVGDPNYVRVRNGLVLPAKGKGGGLKLDGFFVLNPNMPALAALYRKGEALIVHATSTPYRDRSHFDGQDVLESGQPGPGATRSGWLNRALLGLPKGEPVANRNVLALGTAIPLIVRGEAPVATLPPGGRVDQDDEDTRRRLLDLYRHTNPKLAARFEEGLDFTGMTQAVPPAAGPDRLSPVERRFRTAGETAGRLLAQPEGPRIGAVSLLGWDTHAAEGPVIGPLGNLLGALDQTIDGLRVSLGEAWRDTVVAITTEFGRTVHMNGTRGTDHGIATVAFIVGGAIKGGRVLADWPGLSSRALYEGRDLAPTTDIRAVLKGLLRDHLGVSEKALATRVFPSSANVPSINDLVA